MDYRSSIIDAATRVFAEKGYTRATVGDIAAEAGLTKRTVYRHVGSKELLLAAVCHRFVGTRLAVYARPSAKSPAEQLESLIEQYVTIVCSSVEETRVFLEELKHLSPAHQAELGERRQEHVVRLGRVIEAGIREGEFGEVNTDIVPETLLGTIFNVHRWFRADGPLTVTQLATLVSSLFLRGVGWAGRRYDVPSSPDHVLPVPPAAFADEGPRPPYTEQIESLFTAGAAASKADEIVSHILKVSSELFSEKGYDGTSTREIADAAGLTKSALYYYISRKEDTLYYLNLWLTDQGVQSLQEIEISELAPADALRRTVSVHCRLVHENLETFRVFNSEIRFLDSSRFKEIAWKREQYVYYFSNTIRRLVGSGVVGTTVLTAMIIGMLNSMHLWYSREIGPEKVSEVFSELLLKGLISPGAVDEHALASVTRSSAGAT